MSLIFLSEKGKKERTGKGEKRRKRKDVIYVLAPTIFYQAF